MVWFFSFPPRHFIPSFLGGKKFPKFPEKNEFPGSFPPEVVWLGQGKADSPSVGRAGRSGDAEPGSPKFEGIDAFFFKGWLLYNG